MHRPVSAVIITLNEEKYIARCLRSLTWADEILVVDAGSTDRTQEICLDPTAAWATQIRLVQRAWDGFRNQRNFSIREARHEWILVVDSDEACTPELASRILSILDGTGGPSHQAYKVRRIEYFLGKQILHGVWNPSYQDRFFNKRGVEYVNDIHEYPRFPSPPGIIHEALLHSPDFGPEKFLAKMNKYGSIEAQDRVNLGMRTNVFRMFFAFLAMFLKNFFYYGAYKDGFHGFVISLLEGISRAVRHIKIWQYSQAVKTVADSRGVTLKRSRQ